MDEITTEDTGSTFIIKLPHMVDQNTKAKLEVQQPQWLLNSNSVFIFDFTRVISINQNSYTWFALFTSTLKKNNKKAFSLGVNKNILVQFAAHGVIQVFNPQKSIEDILTLAGLKNKTHIKLDSNLINPFIAATIEVLKVQANITVDPGKPVATKTLGNRDISIAAIITMMSKAFTGTISIEFSSAVFLKVYENILGEKYTEINEEVKDGAAEILNMIFGLAKTQLNKNNFQLDKALPNVLIGEKLKVHHGTTGTTLIVPMHSSVGDFDLRISLNA